MEFALDLLTVKPLYLGFFEGLKDSFPIARSSNWYTWRAFILQCGWLILKPLNMTSSHTPKHFACWKMQNFSLSFCVYTGSFASASEASSALDDGRIVILQWRPKIPCHWHLPQKFYILLIRNCRLTMDSKCSVTGLRLVFSIDLISHLLLTHVYFSEKAAGCVREVPLVSEASQLWTAPPRM